MLKYLKCWTNVATMDLVFIFVNVATGYWVWDGDHQVPWLSMLAIVLIFGFLVYSLYHEYERRKRLSTMCEYHDLDQSELDREIAELEKRLAKMDNERLCTCKPDPTVPGPHGSWCPASPR